jgi:hypothetical protein
MGMLGVATRSASALGIGVDMTTGTGWPMGGPWVPDDRASESITLRRYPLAADGSVPEAVRAALAGQDAHPGAGAKTTVICLRAVGPGNEQEDVTGRFGGGRVEWSAPGPGWLLYSLTARQPVQRVKRAAPGGAGSVVDPFSAGAIDAFLSRFDAAFGTYRGAMPRAQFHDSFEYFGANWTPGFPEEFSRRRGYDLREHLAELSGEGDEDVAARVREDYRRTIAELHLAYIAEWTRWSHAHHCLTREQAHGSPANIEDVYAAADIPETEGAFGGGGEEQVPMLKFASSAAHVSGRALASSETFTWLGEHFQVPLSRLKGVADTFFLAGVNHIFLHGIPYSPADAPWPGWLFYASVNFGPNGGLWHDLPAFTAYATRCQSVLQSGAPDNDILLYFPVADFWQRIRPDRNSTPPGGGAGRAAEPLLLQFTTPGEWMLGTPFHECAMELWHRGFAFDEVTDALLEGAQVERPTPGDRPGGAAISLGGSRYRAVVVPVCRYMPVETLRRLLALARHGAAVVFEGDIPSDVPGLADLATRRAELRRLAEGVRFEGLRPGGAGGRAPTVGFSAARLGAGLIVSRVRSPFPEAAGLQDLLLAAGVAREPMSEDGLLCIRRQREGGYDYFIVNAGSRTVEKWITLARPASSAVLLDPLYPDRAGFAAVRQENGSPSAFLQMRPGQSLILRTLAEGAPPGRAWTYLRPASGRPVELRGEWTVHFTEGGPVLPPGFRTARLGSWTEQGGPESERFAGTAVYSLSFSIPGGTDAAREWQLDLGNVAESARVRINGRDVATLWCAPFRADVGRFLSPGENRLEVEVTNVAANRIRDLDRRHVEWKRFYEINFVNREYRPFDASAWPVRDSGLLGPVVLSPMRAFDPGEPP